MMHSPADQYASLSGPDCLGGSAGSSSFDGCADRDQNGEFFGSLMVSFEPHASGPRRSVQMRNSKA